MEKFVENLIKCLSYFGLFALSLIVNGLIFKVFPFLSNKYNFYLTIFVILIAIRYYKKGINPFIKMKLTSFNYKLIPSIVLTGLSTIPVLNFAGVIVLSTNLILTYAAVISGSLFINFASTNTVIETGEQISFFISFLVVVVLAPISEEILFRGLLYPKLKEKFHIVIAIILSASIFALIHGSISASIATFILSLIFIFLYEKTNSIIPCIIFHACHNLFIFFLSFINNELLGSLLLILAFLFFIIGWIWFILLMGKQTKLNNEQF